MTSATQVQSCTCSASISVFLQRHRKSSRGSSEPQVAAGAERKPDPELPAGAPTQPPGSGESLLRGPSLSWPLRGRPGPPAQLCRQVLGPTETRGSSSVFPAGERAAALTPRHPPAPAPGRGGRTTECKDRMNTVLPSAHKPGLQIPHSRAGPTVEGAVAAKRAAPRVRGPPGLLCWLVDAGTPATREHLRNIDLSPPLGTRTGNIPFSVLEVRNTRYQVLAVLAPSSPADWAEGARE